MGTIEEDPEASIWFVPRRAMCAIFWLANALLFTGIILVITSIHKGVLVLRNTCTYVLPNTRLYVAQRTTPAHQCHHNIVYRTWSGHHPPRASVAIA